MDLDLIDRKILYYLDADASQNIAQVAKKLKLGRNVALYRINRMKNEGIIKGSFVELNNPALGYKNFRIFLKLGNFNQSKQEELLNFLSKNKNLLWLSKAIGKWDIDLIFMCKEIKEFENFRQDLFLNFNQIIEDYSTSLLTKIYHYPRDYFLDSKRTSPPKILDISFANNFVLDKKDEELLRLLTKDASMNWADLSRKLKLSINTLRKRINNLEKQNIILGYRLFIDAEKLGYEYYKLHINLRNYNEKDLKEFKSWLGSKNFVIYLDNYIGGEDLEIELHLKSEQEYIEFLNELYGEFSRIIKNHFMLKFYDVKIYRYLPVD